jgi:hypothetical protein
MDDTSRGWGLLLGHQRGPHMATSGDFATAMDTLLARGSPPPTADHSLQERGSGQPARRSRGRASPPARNPMKRHHRESRTDTIQNRPEADPISGFLVHARAVKRLVTGFRAYATRAGHARNHPREAPRNLGGGSALRREPNPPSGCRRGTGGRDGTPEDRGVVLGRPVRPGSPRPAPSPGCTSRLGSDRGLMVPGRRRRGIGQWSAAVICWVGDRQGLAPYSRMSPGRRTGATPIDHGLRGWTSEPCLSLDPPMSW